MNVKITQKQVTIWLCLLLGVIVNAQQPGELDTSFNVGAGIDGTIHNMALQPDGKVIIAGVFTSYNGVARTNLARLNADGSLDTAFNAAAGPNDDIYALTLQPDGKILIGGHFSTYNGVSRSQIARLNTDGSLDTTFDPGTGPGVINSRYYNTTSIGVQSDGKVIVGGSFDTYDGLSRNCIARLYADGSLDGFFDVGTGLFSHQEQDVFSIVVQPDDKLLIGGAFDSYNGISRNRIVRLNADGSLDTTFEPETGADGPVFTVAVQPDSKVLIGGSFSAYNGTERQRLARLNADGSLDTTFTPGTGLVAIQFIATQSDGKIFIGGNFLTYDGVARSNIARLNADGSLDTTFNIGTGAASTILSIVLQPDNKVLIGGYFVTYNSVNVNSVARLYGDEPCNTPAPTASAQQAFCNGSTVASLTATGTAIQWYNTPTGGTVLALTDALTNGTYYAGQALDGCEGPRSAVSVTVISVPAPTGAAEQLISAANATISGIDVTGTNVQWYTAEAEAIAAGNAISPDTVLISGTTYYANQTIDGCTSSTALAVTTTVALGVEDVVKNVSKFYPNPFADELNFESGQIISNIAVYNLYGKLVYEADWNTTSGKLNMSNLQAATYIARVRTGNTVKNLTVIKQ
ncbi:T9SS type A sorting domain-containing protein [Flavobacterium rivuli]|uniref:Ig-like domain-containing protein n=1 Tax=Flavobacterium rivuli TaxID=498301 RepID=UPI00037AAF29|nr:T9SS type A sorting domain-containing protein [Flavobacterium rivuli]